MASTTRCSTMRFASSSVPAQPTIVQAEPTRSNCPSSANNARRRYAALDQSDLELENLDLYFGCAERIAPVEINVASY